MTPIASIIIPTYNHAEFIGDAIRSALVQTVEVEVIVIDDGSTDDTAEVVSRFNDARVKYHRLSHGGPSLARNHGIELASAEYLMFLDADDVIAPTKVADQIAEFTPEIGWVLCDVRIEDEAKTKITTASVQYRYDDKGLGGWIQPQLAHGNFIPIMSPLFRRSALGDSIRFDDRKVPEDYHFMYAVAGVARVRYLPKVLATYRHRRMGRSRLPKKARAHSPNLTQPLRLNLGCGTPSTRSWHPINGMMNLDQSLGWRFEDGLGDFIDQSVAGITVSHALMYVPEKEWVPIFAEFARVLAPGGVIRITEDDAVNPRSARRGGWKGSEPAVTITSAEMLRRYLERAGFAVHDVDATTTQYRDRSLLQSQHGTPPDVFFIEGVRESTVFFAPHSDDETLFGAFTILRDRPRVVICFPSAGDYGTTAVREAETRDAMTVLGASGVEQWDGHNLIQQMRAFDEKYTPTKVFAPDRQTSHRDHFQVSISAATVFGDRVTTYHTYDEGGKVRSPREVPFEPVWLEQKLRALARYRSQIAHPRAHRFFADDLREFYGEVAS
jgi:predicted SAM-dependent methyltransferase